MRDILDGRFAGWSPWMTQEPASVEGVIAPQLYITRKAGNAAKSAERTTEKEQRKAERKWGRASRQKLKNFKSTRKRRGLSAAHLHKNACVRCGRCLRIQTPGRANGLNPAGSWCRQSPASSAGS